MEWFREGLVFKAHRLLYNSTLDSRVIKKKKKVEPLVVEAHDVEPVQKHPPLYRAVQFSIYEQLLIRNVERFRAGLVAKAHRLLYRSTVGSRVIKKKKVEPFVVEAHHVVAVPKYSPLSME